MSLSRTFYNVFLKKTSTFTVTIMVGAVVFERIFDQAGDKLFDNMNSGKLWRHIKHNYEKGGDE